MNFRLSEILIDASGKTGVVCHHSKKQNARRSTAASHKNERGLHRQETPALAGSSEAINKTTGGARR
jgi:hypothetical protein